MSADLPTILADLARYLDQQQQRGGVYFLETGELAGAAGAGAAGAEADTVEPAGAGPAAAGSAGAGPDAAEPAAPEPAAIEPAAIEPAAEPPATQPGAAEPAVTKPAAPEPAAAEPPATQPAAAEPAAAEPASAEPTAAEPVVPPPAPAGVIPAADDPFAAECGRFVRDALARLAAARQAAAPRTARPVSPQESMFGAPGGAAGPAGPATGTPTGTPTGEAPGAGPGSGPGSAAGSAGPAGDPAAALPQAPADRAAALEELAATVRTCTRCALHEGRNLAVPGAGHPAASVVVIGEAPGAEEDRQGLPFVGRSGALLEKILGAIGFARDDVFICNILKCRPPANRDPQADEVLACQGYLQRQLQIIRPRVILCVGRIAAQTLLRTGEPLIRLREEARLYAGIPVVSTYHPAALLRNPENKRLTWEDVRKLRALHDALGTSA